MEDPESNFHAVKWKMTFTLLPLIASATLSSALAPAQLAPREAVHAVSRRAASSLLGAAVATLASEARRARAADFTFVTAGPPGFQYADVKVGTGAAPTKGSKVVIDYVMSTTGARYGAKVDSTVERGEPYRWTLGDGSTIAGLELAILGGGGVEPMKPGGVRRVIIPSNPTSNLGYSELAIPNRNNLQVQDCSTGRGPVPPNLPQKTGDMGAGEFQRFKNIYCNANRPYQPDIVLDVRLFGNKAAAS